MTHLAAATPNLTYACDTHYPWKTQDVVVPTACWRFVDGSVAVPTGPGSASSSTATRSAQLHEQYLSCGVRRREDTVYMRSIQPDFEVNTSRW